LSVEKAGHRRSKSGKKIGLWFLVHGFWLKGPKTEDGRRKRRISDIELGKGAKAQRHKVKNGEE